MGHCWTCLHIFRAQRKDLHLRPERRDPQRISIFRSPDNKVPRHNENCDPNLATCVLVKGIKPYIPIYFSTFAPIMPSAARTSRLITSVLLLSGVPDLANEIRCPCEGSCFSCRRQLIIWKTSHGPCHNFNLKSRPSGSCRQCEWFLLDDLL